MSGFQAICNWIFLGFPNFLSQSCSKKRESLSMIFGKKWVIPVQPKTLFSMKLGISLFQKCLYAFVIIPGFPGFGLQLGLQFQLFFQGVIE